MFPKDSATTFADHYIFCYRFLRLLFYVQVLILNLADEDFTKHSIRSLLILFLPSYLSVALLIPILIIIVIFYLKSVFKTKSRKLRRFKKTIGQFWLGLFVFGYFSLLVVFLINYIQNPKEKMMELTIFSLCFTMYNCLSIMLISNQLHKTFV